MNGNMLSLDVSSDNSQAIQEVLARINIQLEF
jgi:hypothetical protein